MAYRTSHRLKTRYYADFNKELEEDIEEKIEKYIEHNENLSWVISEGLNEWGEDDRSFADSEKNMKNLSIKFPNLIFVLEYEPIQDYQLGERTEYWFDGKVQTQYAEVMVNPFNVNKLKEVN